MNDGVLESGFELVFMIGFLKSRIPSVEWSSMEIGGSFFSVESVVLVDIKLWLVAKSEYLW
jgi:hypothetical protein